MGRSAEALLSDLQVCRALKGCIAEFLDYHGLRTTLKSFEEEFYAKQIADASTLSIPFEAKTAFLQFFKAGDGPSFFTLWDEHTPRESSKALLSLQLELHAYFLTWGFAKGGSRKSQALERFLREWGGQLALEKDQMHFFALPHVADSKTHPQFQELYTVEWREALRQKLEAFLDYRDPAKMSPLLHDMYRDFHTRLEEEFGAGNAAASVDSACARAPNVDREAAARGARAERDSPAASSFERAEDDAMGDFSLGVKGGKQPGVIMQSAAGGGTRESDVRDSSSRRSVANWLRKLEGGVENGRKASPGTGEGAGVLSNSESPVPDYAIPFSNRETDTLSGQKRSTQSMTSDELMRDSDRPMSVRTRPDPSASTRQNLDREPATSNGAFLAGPLGANSNTVTGSVPFSKGTPTGNEVRPDSRGRASLDLESGRGLGVWRGARGSVSQSLAITPSVGSESRPATGSRRRPPKMPQLAIGLGNPVTIEGLGGRGQSTEEELLDKSPSPKVAPSRKEKLSRTNSFGRSEAADQATRVAIWRAHRGSRSMDFSDAGLSFDSRPTGAFHPGPSSEVLRVDQRLGGRSGDLFGGFGADVRDSFQALCDAREVVRRSTHLSLERIDDDPAELPAGSADVRAPKADVDFEQLRRTLYAGADGDVAAALLDLTDRIVASPKNLQTAIAGDPLCLFTVRKQQRPLLALLVERGRDVARALARALNALATKEAGRGYLLTNKKEMVGTLVRVIRLASDGPGSSDALHDALEALQKLSKRRSVQKLVIAHEIVPDLTSLIGARTAAAALDEYGLEHTLALLMALSLRTAGKRACERDAAAVLEALVERLESDSPQVRTFVNGTLYLLLSRLKIRAAARVMDLPALLRAHARSSDAACARQIDHVLTQIQSNADAPETSESDGSSDGEGLGPTRIPAAAPSARRSPPASGAVQNGRMHDRVVPSGDNAHHLQPLSPNLRGDSTAKVAAHTSSSFQAPAASSKAPGKPSTARDAGSENAAAYPGKRPVGGMTDVRQSTDRPIGVRTSTEAFAVRPKVPRTPELHSR